MSAMTSSGLSHDLRLFACGPSHAGREFIISCKTMYAYTCLQGWQRSAFANSYLMQCDAAFGDGSDSWDYEPAAASATTAKWPVLMDGDCDAHVEILQVCVPISVCLPAICHVGACAQCEDCLEV